MPTRQYSATVAWGVVILLVMIAWLISYWAGGSHTVAPHLFYVPVLLAALRLGEVGAVVAGVISGLVAGPLLPLDVANELSQEPVSWLLRLVAFVLIGGAVAFFANQSRYTLGTDLTRAAIRRDLRRALDARQLHVAFQPIIDLATGKTVGAEALIRWTHPDRGAIPPSEFVPAAEDAGAAPLITEFVLAEVAHRLGLWRASGLIGSEEDFEMAVNISAAELHDEKLEILLRDLLVQERFPAHWLHLEVTETAFLADLDGAVSSLRRLRRIGARISIDDFGTGESTLRYLHKFPVDVLKIDRSFIEPLVDDERGRHIVRCVVDLAHDMNLKTVAEGVETPEHADVLRSMGCDLAQGYHFARPLDPVAFEERLVAERRRSPQ